MILNCTISKVLRSILSNTLKAHRIVTQTHIQTHSRCTNVREKPSVFFNQDTLLTTSLHNSLDLAIPQISNSSVSPQQELIT
ncbi:hypothetical protein CDL12_15306 [Handroanthus impetiginosus]|uniref:Uncharacterized protein n=1 Tax=Handroanthus impetiginosus TaxID=429701 RepID=A0A2G9H3I4_9LAMI|nr:hypothetical protein CDL12_15306 [Handroanthus impetiginosus]